MGGAGRPAARRWTRSTALHLLRPGRGRHRARRRALHPLGSCLPRSAGPGGTSLRGYLPARRATRTDDIFSVLCHIETEDGERFSDDDVVNHMIFLMMAAHDTSTITTSTILQLLGQHPEWQERCRQESLALGPEPTLAELEALPSIDLVMKALRLRAPSRSWSARPSGRSSSRASGSPTTPTSSSRSSLAPARGLLDGPDGLRPRALLAGTARGQVAPLRLVAVRRRRAQVHRPLLRRRRGQGDHAPAPARPPLDRRPVLRRPLDNHALPFPKDGQPIDLVRDGSR